MKASTNLVNNLYNDQYVGFPTVLRCSKQVSEVNIEVWGCIVKAEKDHRQQYYIVHKLLS
jgi:hypothetical protein